MNQSNSPEQTNSKLIPRFRTAFHYVGFTFALIYLALAIFGVLPPESRLESSEMALVIFLILITSNLVDSLVDISFGSFKAQFKTVEDRQDEQQSEIRSLQVALNGIVTGYEYDKLVGLSAEGPFNCRFSGDLVNELKRLRSMGFVKNHDGVGIRTIVHKYEFKDNRTEFDLKKYFFITDAGQEYLTLRQEIEDAKSAE